MINVNPNGALIRIALAMVALLGIPALVAGQAQASPHHQIDAFEAELSDYQAGGHPDATTSMTLGREPGPSPGFGDFIDAETIIGGAPKDIFVTLPPGISGNPVGIPKCNRFDLVESHCASETQVGAMNAYLGFNGGYAPRMYPVFNVEPDRGEVARFALSPFNAVTTTYVSLHVVPNENGEYVLTANAENINDGAPIGGFEFQVWGVPADPIHDPLRGCPDFNPNLGCSTSDDPKPFFTAPSQCGVEKDALLQVRSYQFPTDADWTEKTSVPHAVTGCNQLDFSPTIEARPTTNVADSPTGLEVKLNVPQNEDPNGLAEAYLKKVEMKLPAGLTVNPSSAAGLGACSLAEIGMSADGKPNADPANCPLASKLGTVELETPAIDHPVKGAVYLAQQNANPFNSLLALYIVIEDAQNGITIKLPGKVEPDPQSGQLTAIFDNNPQFPFEDLDVNFFSGPRAALKTAVNCGKFTTTSALTPWTAPEGATATPSDSFQIDRGAGDGACAGSEAQAPNAPAFTAGTVDPTAAAYSPFVLRLARADGSQRIGAIDTTLPSGLLGRLAGTTYCSDAALAAAAGRAGKDEQAVPSCPASSRVGSVNVGAGVGPAPLYVGGNAYLAGPYKGAPLSLAIVTPAVAGPFDLGTVVVRTALDVDPVTTRIRAVSDPIPSILQGIPLDLRSIALTMDRPDFTLNPTSCDPTSITGAATSLLGQSAALTSPFQVGGCPALGFKPKLALNLKGGTKRGGYPALKAVVTAQPDQANISRVSVALPHSEFLAQEHINTICTRVQFSADACPAGSIYGKATASTPLLDQPLQGQVYLRSSSNPLPDLVVALRGQIDVDLVGRIDSVHAGIRNTFDLVPDAPVSRFVLEMKGGKKGLLVNSRNICKSINKANVKIEGQNGKTADQTPVLRNSCKKAEKAHKKKAHKKTKKG